MIRGVVSASVRRPVAVTMAALAVAAFGLVALGRLPLDLLPRLSFPSLTVRTELTNAAPAEVETLVSRPVEEVLGVLQGLKEIHSLSRPGLSEVTLSFGWHSDMEAVVLDLREKLDRLVLPEEAGQPLVLRFDPAEDPIMRLALAGDEGLVELRDTAEKVVKVALERLEGVASAQIKGGAEEEVAIDVDQGKLAALGLSMRDLAAFLRAANINRPGGAIETVETRYLVRTINEYDSLEELRNLVISEAEAAPVRLADVATVEIRPADRDEIFRVAGREAVLIEVFKEGDANSMAVAGALRRALDTLRPRLGSRAQLEVLSDQSRFIGRAIAELRDALLIGGALAILVLWVFLRDWRATAIIAAAIPLSLIATFIAMYRLDVSLNIMSLGGLTLGAGMLVDGAIVVLEAIHRRREEGQSRAVAAIEGTTGVGAAVAASVMTTVAVFFPIVFVEGIAGQLFRDQALTVTFSLVASLVVALTLVPMLAALGRDGGAGRLGRRPLFEALERRYGRALGWALRHRGRVLGGALVLFLLTLTLVPGLPRTLIPTMRQGEFFFDVALPEGRSLQATEGVIEAMEEVVRQRPAVALYHASAGTRSSAAGAPVEGRGEHLGQLHVVLRDRSDEALEEREVEALRQTFSALPGVDVRLGRPAFFSLATPFELRLFGEDLASLRRYAALLRPRLEAIPGLGDVRSSVAAGNPELALRFDRARLARLGLTIDEVSEALRDRVQGVVASTYKVDDRQLDLRLRTLEDQRDSRGDMGNLVVGLVRGQPVTLAAVARLEPARGPAEIHRVQQSRAAVLTADIAGSSLSSVVEQARAALAETPPPPDIVAEIAGQSEDMSESFASLGFAAGLALFLVYLVMAATFESFLHPLLIMGTVPLALIGAVLGLAVTGYEISVIAAIGAVFLVGVVVNNGIVMVDGINRRRRQGRPLDEAVVEACERRLRPILMTALTTVLGLAPMALSLGEGVELRAPLAIVVSWGLVSATLLTLFVIPVAYRILPSRVRTEAEDEALAAELDQLAQPIAGAGP